MRLVRNAGQHQWLPASLTDGLRYCEFCGVLEEVARGRQCSGVKGILGRPVVEDLMGRDAAEFPPVPMPPTAPGAPCPPVPRPVKNRRGISPASPAQRAKVRDLVCVVCGKDRHEAMVDPAHIVPRSLLTEGQDDPLAVVPLCREHHDQFDRADLDLLPYLEPAYSAELGDAVRRFGLLPTLRQVTGCRWTTEDAA